MHHCPIAYMKERTCTGTLPSMAATSEKDHHRRASPSWGLRSRGGPTGTASWCSSTSGAVLARALGSGASAGGGAQRHTVRTLACSVTLGWLGILYSWS